jgi:hypothetical protein
MGEILFFEFLAHFYKILVFIYKFIVDGSIPGGEGAMWRHIDGDLRFWKLVKLGSYSVLSMCVKFALEF